MKKITAGILIMCTLVFGAMDGDNHKGAKNMKMYQSVPMQKAIIVQKGDSKMFCSSCGMSLPMFYRTNHTAVNGDHTEQYCSLHCLVEVNMKNNGSLKDIKVVDNETLKFIDATKATYVVGSSKKGTMSSVSKYAFANKDKAQKFADKFGGELKSFDETYKIAEKSLKKEMMMISKKQTKMAKKGEMIYNKMCKKTDIKFKSTAQAKAFVTSSKICGNMKGEKLQAVGLYLGKR